MREGNGSADLAARPTASVIVLSYNSRGRIDTALQSLRAQRFDEHFEVIVVDSGGDGSADYVRSAYPEVRLLRSETRLWPGAARNRGLRAARGECVAFLSDDSAARPDWLRRRVDLHRRGFDLVGGAVVNGTAGSPVGTAGYLLEYSAVLPSRRVLSEQEVPHSLSYSRETLARVGGFPEDIRTGEDTVTNERLLRAQATVALDPGIQIAHQGPNELRAYLRHNYLHGRGLVQCVDRHGHRSAAMPNRDSARRALLAMFIRYPALRWSRALLRLARGRPRSVPAFVALTPLVWSGLWATSLGAWSQWRRERGPLPPPPPRAIAEADGHEPVISAIVPSYRSRRRIDHALRSLRRQDLDEPWEVIVVDSGDDGAADYVTAAYPEVRIVRSTRRLYPGAARNAGVRAARGRYVAFLPDDGVAEPDWLRRRLQRHREGHAAVGGAITNGTPWHPVGTASYFVEYSALLPSGGILKEQEIPHCLSYERALVQRLGGFPEELETGEDTVLNARLLEEEVVELDPRIRLAHVNLTSLRAYLRHLYEHGHGFGLAGGSYGPPSRWMSRAGRAHAAARILLAYPVIRWWSTLLRVARGQPRSLPLYLALTPLVWAGLWAAAAGRWAGFNARARFARPPEGLPG